MDKPLPGMILVDAHVHLHGCFDLAAAVDAACANFERVARAHGAGNRFAGMLLLAEGCREDGYDRLLRLMEQQVAGAARLGRWRLHRTRESVAIGLRSDEEHMLVVIAGRQIRTRENLEVLAVGTRQQFEDGRPAERVIRDVAETGAVPILPWGLGRWMSSRGRLLEQLVQDPGLPPFFLGDSANRPAAWPRSPLFRTAAESGIRDLPGSDPLPFPAESRRPGCYGFILDDRPDLAEPMGDLKAKLLDPRVSIRPFGRGERPLRCLRNQLAMQYRKRRGKQVAR